MLKIENLTGNTRHLLNLMLEYRTSSPFFDIRDVEDATGMPENAINRTFEIMLHDGLVTKDQDMGYTLTDPYGVAIAKAVNRSLAPERIKQQLHIATTALDAVRDILKTLQEE